MYFLSVFYLDPISEHDLQKTKKIKDTRRTIQGAIALLVILGVSNIFMVFMISDTQTKEIVAYFFIIFNALQGRFNDRQKYLQIAIFHES